MYTCQETDATDRHEHHHSDFQWHQDTDNDYTNDKGRGDACKEVSAGLSSTSHSMLSRQISSFLRP